MYGVSKINSEQNIMLTTVPGAQYSAQSLAEHLDVFAKACLLYTSVRQKRGAQELGISSIRGGGIVGEHDVLFCGPAEVVTLSHSAGSRGVFADGAVQSALYIAALAPGYYTMTCLLYTSVVELLEGAVVQRLTDALHQVVVKIQVVHNLSLIHICELDWQGANAMLPMALLLGGLLGGALSALRGSR